MRKVRGIPILIGTNCGFSAKKAFQDREGGCAS